MFFLDAANALDEENLVEDQSQSGVLIPNSAINPETLDMHTRSNIPKLVQNTSKSVEEYQRYTHRMLIHHV